MATPPLPPPDATPVAVRGWFTTILTDLHSLPAPDAIEIASKWRYGRGSELTYYDMETFRLIFGAEAGTVLFGHARRELRTGKSSSSMGFGRSSRDVVASEIVKEDMFGLPPGSPVYMFFGLALLMGFGAYVERNHSRFEFLLLTALSGVLFLGSFLYFLFRAWLTWYVLTS